MEAILVSLMSTGITACSFFVDSAGLRPLLQITRSGAAQQVQLRNDTTALYVRRERLDRRRVINVFDGNGVKVYTIERKTIFSPVWSILRFPSRIEVATVHAGAFDRYVDFHNKTDIQHRQLTAEMGITGRFRRFYLNDGASYEWSRASRYLERVINPGGGDEEIRERIAKARLMRQFRFYFELLMDESKIDREIVLATAFISMITQWGLGNRTDTRGPTVIPKQLLKTATHQTKEVIATIEEPSASNEDIAVSTQISIVQPEPQQRLIEPIQVENRVFLVVEGPDGSSKWQNFDISF